MIDLQYKLIDDGTLCVSSYTGDEALVEVPEAVDGIPVTVISDGVFRGHSAAGLRHRSGRIHPGRL